MMGKDGAGDRISPEMIDRIKRNEKTKHPALEKQGAKGTTFSILDRAFLSG